MDIKFILIDTSDSYHTSIGKFKTKEEMLDAIQYRTLSEIEVYEVTRKVRLAMRPAIV